LARLGVGRCIVFIHNHNEIAGLFDLVPSKTYGFHAIERIRRVSPNERGQRHADLAAICAHEGTRNLAANMMREAQQIGEKLGIEFRIPLEKRIAGAAEVGAHKTSMLQDLEAGRALETEALIGAVAELGELVDVPSPAINSVLACLRLLARTTLHG
jgi:hypothetical protein